MRQKASRVPARHGDGVENSETGINAVNGGSRRGQKRLFRLRGAQDNAEKGGCVLIERGYIAALGAASS